MSECVRSLLFLPPWRAPLVRAIDFCTLAKQLEADNFHRALSYNVCRCVIADEKSSPDRAGKEEKKSKFNSL